MPDVIFDRVQILTALMDGEVEAKELPKKVHLPPKEISDHLNTLTKLNILEIRKEGIDIIYSIRENKKEQVSKLLKQYR